MSDAVVSPGHYKSHPSGVECIQITRHMGFNLGNAVKYIWRADLKHDDGGVEDLEKALTYVADEIQRRKGAKLSRPPIVLQALPVQDEVILSDIGPGRSLALVSEGRWMGYAKAKAVHRVGHSVYGVDLSPVRE